MSALRVAMVLQAWPGDRAGGTGMVVDALSHALVELGHRVCVLAPSQSIDSDAAGDSRIEVRGLTAPEPKRWSETWSKPVIDHEFETFLAHWRPDIIHIHHLSGLSMGMISAASARGVRVVLCLHDYSIPCIRGQLVTQDGELCDGPRAETCAVCMRHMSPGGPRLSRLTRTLARIPGVERSGRAIISRLPPRTTPLEVHARERMAAASRALRAVDRLEAPSEDLCSRIESMGLPRPFLAPLPLVHDIGAAPAGPEGDEDEPLRILFVGSLIPTKGAMRLVDAFEQLPTGSATLTLAGDAPSFFGSTRYGDALKDRVASIPSARLRGSVPSSMIGALLHTHDVLVLPSTWPENSPLVIREATAAGLRTVWSTIGGACELDPDGRAVSPEGVEPLVHALRAEVALGRTRRPPLRWPTPTEVAEWHIAHSYSSCSSDEPGSIGNLSP